MGLAVPCPWLCQDTFFLKHLWSTYLTMQLFTKEWKEQFAIETNQANQKPKKKKKKKRERERSLKKTWLVFPPEMHSDSWCGATVWTIKGGAQMQADSINWKLTVFLKSFFLKMYIILKVTFHLQLLQNVGYIPPCCTINCSAYLTHNSWYLPFPLPYPAPPSTPYW